MLVNVQPHLVHELGEQDSSAERREEANVFGNSQMGGVNIGFPDVCMTPPVPLPIPYPNISMGPVGFPPSPNVLWMATPAHHLMTTPVFSMGDNPGIATGVASGTEVAPGTEVEPGTEVGLGTEVEPARVRHTGSRLIPSMPSSAKNFRWSASS